MILKTAAQPAWRSTWSTSVDYSTMVMGYALKYLPDNFYPTYNSAIISDTTTTAAPTTTKSTTATTTPTTTKTTTTAGEFLFRIIFPKYHNLEHTPEIYRFPYTIFRIHSVLYIH